MKSPTAKRLPPKNCCRILNEYAVLVKDPVQKLKFIEQSLKNYNKIPSIYKAYSSFGEIAFRKVILDEADRVSPGSRARAQELINKGTISPPHPVLLSLYKYRYIVILSVLSAFVWGLGTGVASISKVIFETTDQSKRAELSPSPQPGPTASIKEVQTSMPKGAVPDIIKRESFPEYITEPIWLVEKTGEFELYSNRLQIITTYAVDNILREYIDFSKSSDQLPGLNHTTDKIVGILYHASESDIVPFSPEENQSIKKYSELLRRYICREKLYHYFIDRFGRVFRVVREEHAAFHAGNSIWSDENSIYINLNHAFVGICFEGKDFQENKRRRSGKPSISVMKESSINENQIKSAKELTDLLRYKYKISQHNCIPHGIASVNPDKKLIGYHLDLSHSFPFHRFGLTDKYQEPLPSIVEFGFTYDQYFLKIFDGDTWPGISKSEKYIEKMAKSAQLSTAKYRKKLNRHYDELKVLQEELNEALESKATAQELM